MKSVQGKQLWDTLFVACGCYRVEEQFQRAYAENCAMHDGKTSCRFVLVFVAGDRSAVNQQQVCARLKLRMEARRLALRLREQEVSNHTGIHVGGGRARLM
ncbi:MAG TPA: hypothetical protein VFW73_09630 [Lacipirellulaceae bacterium]|nr:hypothetical protein [Lacipirellulaceae bacterium]